MFERPPFDNDRIFTGWLEQDATLRPPDDLLERVLSGTAATRRRPGWLVIERWFPMEKTARFGAIPRAALLVGTLGVLLVLLAAIAAASQPRLPDPFGPARNGAIIYSQDGDIHVADADGSNPRAIVTGPDDDRYPSFSRDGTRIAFGRGPDSHLALMVANADGTEPTKLLDDVYQGDFMPDGDRFFVTHQVDGRMVLSLVDVTGSGQVVTLPTGDQELWGWVVARPPDGRELIFMDHVRPGGPERAIYAIATDGKTPPRMIGAADTKGSPDGAPNTTASWSFQEPSISPDGNTIAYWSWEPRADGLSSQPHLHLRDLDTGKELPVPFARPNGNGLSPHFSPDGRWIIFESTSSRSGGEQQIYRAPVDGSHPAEPIGPPFTYTYRHGFDWSPDGSAVLLSLTDPGTTVIIDVATQATTEVPGIVDTWGWQRLAP